MSEPFLAEIKIVGFNFAPRSWAFCDGQILPINQNQSLYSLLGTTYGGDGRTTFALPDLRGRSPVHFGDGITQGQKGGEETHILTENELPVHDHVARGSSNPADTPIPLDQVLADSAPNEIYHTPTSLEDLRAGTTGNRGGGQGHQNMQPYLTLNFVIAIQGLFPSRN
jgi:microcystin-dependent protein